MIRIVVPVQITESLVDSSSIAADSNPAWLAAATYSSGDIVVAENSDGVDHIYKWFPPDEDSSVNATAGWSPADHSVISRAKMNHTVASNHTDYHRYWLDLGPTNRMAMFDGRSRAASTDADQIVVSFTPGALIGGLGLVNLVADAVEVTVVDPGEGEVYSRTVSTENVDKLIDYYAWFFSPLDTKSSLALTDLPPYPDATVTMTVTATGKTAQIGELVVGEVLEVGVMLYGSSVGGASWSMTEDDDAGVATLVTSIARQTTEFDVSLPTAQYSYIKRMLAALIDTPAIYVGDDEEESLVFGKYRQFSINLKGVTRSDCTLTIEEFV